VNDAVPYAKVSLAVVASAAIAVNIWHGFQTRKATKATTRQATASEALALASQRQAEASERLADEARRNRALDWRRPFRMSDEGAPIAHEPRNRVSPG
jgi:hypothetical protein